MNPYSLSLTLLRTLAIAYAIATLGAFIDGFLTRNPDTSPNEYLSGYAPALILGLILWTAVLLLSPALARLISKGTDNVEFKWHSNIFKTALRVVGIWLVMANAGAIMDVMGVQAMQPQNPLFDLIAINRDSITHLVMGIVLVFTSNRISQWFENSDQRTSKNLTEESL